MSLVGLSQWSVASRGKGGVAEQLVTCNHDDDDHDEDDDQVDDDERDEDDQHDQHDQDDKENWEQIWWKK